MSESLPFRLRNMFACACKEPAEAADRIEKLEAALEDMSQYVSRADWYYLKNETRKALGEKE